MLSLKGLLIFFNQNVLLKFGREQRIETQALQLRSLNMEMSMPF
jgi:hypothetical protein